MKKLSSSKKRTTTNMSVGKSLALMCLYFLFIDLFIEVILIG